jgi:RNA polymerase sigma-70 factor (ECF subfamily)
VSEGAQHGFPPNPADDANLVQAALRGERAALAQLAARLVCVPRILHALDQQRRGLLGKSELEDLAQDTILRLWQKLESFPAYATLEMWAFRFCQYEYLNRLRRLDRHSRPSMAKPPEPEVQDPEPESIDWGAQLDMALDDLDPAEAELIRMKHFEERTFEEVAKAFHIPVNTAKARYYRGLAKLRERLRRWHSAEDLP